ncbi:MAG: PUR family DNA/RNA-binding protein [Bacteroidales bacterium]|nr:PUR family DNA/RNA-binding protein [Bacteroidales bacterium]
MYYEDYDNAGFQDRNGDDVYSKPVRAGKRTYFFDVKATKGNDYYLTITESKRRIERDGRYVYDKHKIFLYKEDFDKFADGLQEVVNYIRERCPAGTETVPPERPEAPAQESPTPFSDVNFEEL